MKLIVLHLFVFVFVFILFSDENYGQAKGMLIPAFAEVSTPGGSNSGLGTGIGFQSLFYGRIIALGLCIESAWWEFLNPTVGYFKIMPRIGFGYVDDDYHGFFVGGSYGYFTADNGGGDNTTYNLYTGQIYQGNNIYSGGGLGVWMHLSYGDIAMDISYDTGGDFKVTRVGFIFLYVVTINIANISGPSMSGTFIYPGLTLRF